MIVGVPWERKDGENRVGLDPEHIRLLLDEFKGADDEVSVIVEPGAGIGAGWHNEDYLKAGAFVVEGHGAIYSLSHSIVKVKEILPEEYILVRDGQAFAGFFHLPANPRLQQLIADKHLKTLVYEDVVDECGGRPILASMSVIAGEAAADKSFGYLMGRRGGVDPAQIKALVIGRGNVGLAAAKVLVGHGLRSKNICILEGDPARVNRMSAFTEDVCEPQTVAWAVEDADIIIGAAASRKKEAPKVITRAMLATMRAGGVFVDVAVDEGGISETTRHTSHSEPTFEECGVLHYCVPNIPGAYPTRATQDLSAAAFPYIVKFIRSLM